MPHISELAATSRRGYTLAELMITMSVIAVISAIAMPSFINYVQGASLRAGAEEMMSVLNTARSVAIKENTQVCVPRGGTDQVRLLIAATNPCASAVFYGQAGHNTDARVGANGWMTMSNGVEVTATTADVIFTSLGAAVPAGTYTVSKDGQTLRVVVAASGRITITP